MRIKDYIKAIAITLPPESTTRENCTECGGYKTLTITMASGRAVYNCFRASCNLKPSSVGITREARDRVQLLQSRPASEGKQSFSVPPYWVDGIGGNDCVEYMQSKHMMEAYEKGLFRPMYDPADRRFVFPIRLQRNGKERSSPPARGSSGEIVGAFGRALDNRQPKVLNYMQSYDVPFVCGKGNELWLVEDGASAVSVTRRDGAVGMALLGTVLKQALIPFIVCYDKVVIALDADAYHKAFKIKKTLSNYHNRVQIFKLNNDIKDMENWT